MQLHDYGIGEEFISSSVHDKSHIFHPVREHQELLFDITSWRDGKYERREKIEIPNYQTSSEKESKKDEDIIFKCQNQGKNGRLRKFLGPLCRSGILEGRKLLTSCYIVLPDDRPNWRNNSSMPSLSDNNSFDTSCNNPPLVAEMTANESDGIKIQSDDQIMVSVDVDCSYLMEVHYAVSIV
ncbi:hypothetical protein RhiirA4_469922 [Rhizophagus irregularis]|uniref:Uncharacterized protein n=1 Tax=Rhizophagus irregularis TaxID=588596 RepID=A0A2I1H0I9_9GLOM|nr:hypothetical protein RhiirA4_469922 [Rhizophagus irregularis]